MSIPRPKRATTSRRAESAASRAATASSKPPKWKDVVGEQPDQAFVAYSSEATFALNALVTHPKFGKGLVLEVDGNKVQILFEEGIRKLIHGMTE